MTRMVRVWRAVRDWFLPVNGARLIREAEREVIGGQEVITFPRMLTTKELNAVREEWKRAHTEGRQ